MRYGCSLTTIRNDLIKHGYPAYKGKEAIVCFDALETEHDYYWYGYFMGDSSCTTDNLLALSSVDKDHLQRFIDHYKLHPRVKIRLNKKAVGNQRALYSFNLNSKKLVHKLRTLGFTKGLKCTRVLPDLSLTSILTPHLTDAFWRGMFDADGGVGHCIRPTYTAPIHFVEAFRDHVNIPSERRNNNRDDHAGCFYPRPNGTTAEVKYSFGQTTPLFTKLYSNAHIYLPRKRDLVKLLLGI
jgi:hypothetical protein